MDLSEAAPRFDPPEPMALIAAPGQSPYLDHWRERAGLAPPTMRAGSALLDALIDSAFAPPEGEEIKAPDLPDDGAAEMGARGE